MFRNIKLSFISFALLIFATASFSQSQPAKKTSPGGSLPAEKVKMLTRAWQLDSTEVFGVTKAATAKEKTDGITFVADGSLFYTYEGTASTGTWKYTGGQINIITNNPQLGQQGSMRFTIKALSQSLMVLAYQTPDLITIQYTYKPKG